MESSQTTDQKCSPKGYADGDDFQQKVFCDQLIKAGIDFIGKKIVDAGCGPGKITYIIAQTADDVLGFDISGERIEHAKEHYKKRES